MHFVIISLFPKIINDSLFCSLARRALREEKWSYTLVDLKDFGIGIHKKVDDEPYGGGNGLVIRPDVLGACIDHTIATYKCEKIFYFSPRGALLNQHKVTSIVESDNNVLLICGRFEGIDQRVIEYYKIEEISIGDYILSGGELAALVLMDACIRLLPGVVANEDTLRHESFSQANDGMLEYPLYTRPATWNNLSVPDVLKSGNHQLINEWHKQESYNVTRQIRPDISAQRRHC